MAGVHMAGVHMAGVQVLGAVEQASNQAGSSEPSLQYKAYGAAFESLLLEVCINLHILDLHCQICPCGAAFFHNQRQANMQC